MNTKNAEIKKGRRCVDLLGQKFGRLFVTGRNPIAYIAPCRKNKRSSGEIRWNCICDCGEKVTVLGCHLKGGKTTKCKKCKYKSMKLNGKLSGGFLAHIKYQAKIRSIPWNSNVSKEYLQKLYDDQKGICALSGLPIVFANSVEEHKHGSTTASLDRIDSGIGYEKGNICWVHKSINMMKWDTSKKEFLNLCIIICKFNNLIPS